MVDEIVIVGAGQAADQAVHTLRRSGYQGQLSLIGDEPWLPYQRPPLSKKFLAGALARERLVLRPELFYQEHHVQAHLGRRVEEIDRTRQRVRLDDGTLLPYGALLLATGSRPRPLTVPGTELQGVYTLRTIADVERIRSQLRSGARMVVIGGGYIGLEVAATARELGLEVTVLEMAERTMNRVTCPEVSAFFAAEHAAHGVRIVVNAKVQALRGTGGQVESVHTEDRGQYPADLVIVGVGVMPADELAVAAGIECANGIMVDAHCRTSDPAVYAAGDCTNHPSLHYERRVRLESVDHAFEQGASAAHNMRGVHTVHNKVPWFWSDQYDLKLIIIGLSHGHDQVVLRGTPASRSFSACYLRAGELIAVDTVNSAKDQMAARKLIAARARPRIDRLVDPGIPLKDAA